MAACVEVPFLPSDVDRLIIGYLNDSKYTETYKTLLRESPFLHEYVHMLNSGIVCPTTTCDGLSLLDILSEFFCQKRRQRQSTKRAAHGRLSQARENLQSSQAESSTLLSSTASVMMHISTAQLRLFQQQAQQQLVVQPAPPPQVSPSPQSPLPQTAQPLSQSAHTQSPQNHSSQLHDGAEEAPAMETMESKSETVATAESEDAAAATVDNVAEADTSFEPMETSGSPLQSSASHLLGHKKKRRPRKELNPTSVVNVPLNTKPVEERKKLIDRILSSPDKFANSWDQAVSSHRLDTDTEKLKQLLDGEQTEDRSELADIFLSAFLDDCATTPLEAVPVSNDEGATSSAQFLQQEVPVEKLFEQPQLHQELHQQPLADSDEEANVVCDSEHIESILTEMNTGSPYPGLTPNKLAAAVAETFNHNGELRRLNSATPPVAHQPPAENALAAEAREVIAAELVSVNQQLMALEMQQKERPRKQLPDHSGYFSTTCDLDETFSSENDDFQAASAPPAPSKSPPTSPVSVPSASAAYTMSRLEAEPEPAAQPKPTATAASSRRRARAPSSPASTVSQSDAASVSSTRRRARAARSPSSAASPMRNRLRKHPQRTAPPSPAAEEMTPSATAGSSGTKILRGKESAVLVCRHCGHSYADRFRLLRHLAVHKEIKTLSSESASAAAAAAASVGATAAAAAAAASAAAATADATAKPANPRVSNKRSSSALSKRVRVDLKAMDINSFINSISLRK